MFGSRPRPKKPLLLVVVFGVLLVLVGITATAQAVMVSAYASGSTLNSIVDGDVATLRGFIHQGLEGVDPEHPDAAAIIRIEGLLQTLTAKGGIAHVEIRTTDGRTLASSAGSSEVLSSPRTPEFDAAVAGSPRVAIVSAGDSEAGLAGLPDTMVREYLPLRQGDRTLLVVGIWRDALPVLARLDGLRRDVVIVTLTAALIAATSCSWSSGQRRRPSIARRMPWSRLPSAMRSRTSRTMVRSSLTLPPRSNGGEKPRPDSASPSSTSTTSSS